jgi:hypothetical protein
MRERPAARFNPVDDEPSIPAVEILRNRAERDNLVCTTLNARSEEFTTSAQKQLRESPVPVSKADA